VFDVTFDVDIKRGMSHYTRNPTPVTERQNLQAKFWHLKTSTERNTNELWLVTMGTTFEKLRSWPS